MLRTLVSSLALAAALSVLLSAPASAAFILTSPIGPDSVVSEGNNSQFGQIASLSIVDNQPSPERRCVTWATVPGSATPVQGGNPATGDYFSGGGEVCLEPHFSSQPILITVVGDSNVEPDESFSVRLSNAYTNSGPYAIADDVAQVTILNDDAPPPPPSSGAPPPPADDPDPQPWECTIPKMEEHYGDRDGPWPEGEGQFYGLMWGAAKNFARGGITSLLDGRAKLTNVLTCPKGTLAGRVHLLRTGKPPLLLAAGKRTLDYHGPGRTSVRLQRRAGARSALRGKARVRARVSIRHVDPEGTAAKRRFLVTLTRAASSGRG